MKDIFHCSFTHFIRTLITPSKLKRVKLILLILASLPVMGSSAMAEEQCGTLGLRTVNWKSPDTNETGVLIVDVYSDCVAARLGVHTGQFITGFNGKPVANKYDLEKLAGKHGAEQAFSITLKDSSGQTKTLTRDALPVQTIDEAVLPIPAEISGEWLSWFGWAGLFLVLSLTMTPLMGWILLNHAQEIALGGAAGRVYEEFKQGGRKYVEAGVNGALMSLGMLLAIILIGPLGLIYTLYQPLVAMVSDADRKVCCVEDEGEYAMSPDGRWLAMVKPTPNRYFGLGDKIARTPHIAALADLQSGQFVSWKNGADKRWRGIEASGNNSLSGVYFDTNDQRPYASWSNGFGTPIEPPDQKILVDQSGIVRQPEVRYSMVSEAGGRFVFSEYGTGKSFTLDPQQPYDKWWLSPDGRVLALVTRPYQPDQQYDGWFKRTYHILRNFLLDDWTVTFWEVGAQRRLQTYHGYGYDKARREDGRFLQASLDGRRWVMVRDNGFAFSFDLTRKIALAYAAGRVTGLLYLAEHDQPEISFAIRREAPSENLEILAQQVERTQTLILEINPQIGDALEATFGQSYAPLMDIFKVETPAKLTSDGGLTYTLCITPACDAERLVVYISPSLNVSALLFHSGHRIHLPETPAPGEVSTEQRLVLYQSSAYPQMAWQLYQAAFPDQDQIADAPPDGSLGRMSSHLWIVANLF